MYLGVAKTFVKVLLETATPCLARKLIKPAHISIRILNGCHYFLLVYNLKPQRIQTQPRHTWYHHHPFIKRAVPIFGHGSSGKGAGHDSVEQVRQCRLWTFPQDRLLITSFNPRNQETNAKEIDRSDLLAQFNRAQAGRLIPPSSATANLRSKMCTQIMPDETSNSFFLHQGLVNNDMSYFREKLHTAAAHERIHKHSWIKSVIDATAAADRHKVARLRFEKFAMAHEEVAMRRYLLSSTPSRRCLD